MRLPNWHIELAMHWRKSFRLWSVRLGMFAALCFGYLIQNPDVPAQILNTLPPEARTWLSPFASAAIFALIWFTRMAKQVIPEVEQQEGQTNAKSSGPTAAGTAAEIQPIKPT